ncbi:MAG: 50S ribosomal protein L30 [Phocaeicola sp.]|uniref:50S ribosomal protein L30 n=1 Tax=Phocaeicola TaxID=909656 RepID=UPI00234F8ED1|nr:50S ribosomal protein L30 [Phocaeicola oris]MCE2616997.1 50S ribosomal protein L30 [Phocaeicola oris]
MSIIKIKQIKSRNRVCERQRRTLDTLGLHKLNQVVEREDTPSVLGLVEKVKHLVTIIK